MCESCEHYVKRLTTNITDGVCKGLKEEEFCGLGLLDLSKLDLSKDNDLICYKYKEKYNKDTHIAKLEKDNDFWKTRCKMSEFEAFLYKCIIDDNQKAHDKIVKRFSSMLHIARQKSVKMSSYDYCKMLGENDKLKKELIQKTTAIANLLAIIKTKSDTIFELHDKLKKEKMQSDKWQEAFLSLETKGFKKFVIETLIGKIKGIAK